MKNYDDIIRLPHPVSAKHRQMPIADRAAQFMPFAALTGYEAALAETARLTSPRIEQDDSQRERLNRQLSFLQSLAAEAACKSPDAAPHAQAYMSEAPHAAQAAVPLLITVTYFCPDTKKEGGAYLTASGIFQKVDPYAQLLYLAPAAAEDAALSTAGTDLAAAAAAMSDPSLNAGSAADTPPFGQTPERQAIPLADILRIDGACFSASAF